MTTLRNVIAREDLTTARRANLARAIKLDGRTDAELARLAWHGVTGAPSRLARMRLGQSWSASNIEAIACALGIDLDGIDWVIVGGESGPGARPMESRWARSIRDQCAAAGVPYREAFTSGLFRFSDFVSVLGPGGHVAGYTRFEGEAWARMYCERPEDEDGNPTGAAFAGGLDLDTVVLESLGAL